MLGGPRVDHYIESWPRGAARCQVTGCYNCGAEGHTSRNCPEVVAKKDKMAWDYEANNTNRAAGSRAPRPPLPRVRAPRLAQGACLRCIGRAGCVRAHDGASRVALVLRHAWPPVDESAVFVVLVRYQ